MEKRGVWVLVLSLHAAPTSLIRTLPWPPSQQLHRQRKTACLPRVCKGPCELCIGHLEGRDGWPAAHRAGPDCKMWAGRAAQRQPVSRPLVADVCREMEASRLGRRGTTQPGQLAVSALLPGGSGVSGHGREGSPDAREPRSASGRANLWPEGAVGGCSTWPSFAQAAVCMHFLALTPVPSFP